MPKLQRLLPGLLCLLLTATARAEPPPPPTLDNKAWILVDFDTGAVLAAHNEHAPLPPASLTKMMTSYLVEQRLLQGQLREDDTVFVSPHAWCRGRNSESCTFLSVNRRARAIDLLRGVIVQSGNDAARALAEHLGGSEIAFAALMNQEAQRLGMRDSRFVNATGLSETGHVASAFDLAILARAIIRDSARYYPLYAEESFTYNAIRQGNRNALLYTDPSVDGLKTGHTEAAGYCLVASSVRNGRRLISVVLGAPSQQARADQSRALFNWGFANFRNVPVLAAQQAVGSARVWFGTQESVPVVAAHDLTVVVPVGTRERLRTLLHLEPKLEAPVAAGQALGHVEISLDGRVLARTPALARDALPEAGLFSRLWQHLVLWLGRFF